MYDKLLQSIENNLLLLNDKVKTMEVTKDTTTEYYKEIIKRKEEEIDSILKEDSKKTRQTSQKDYFKDRENEKLLFEIGILKEKLEENERKITKQSKTILENKENQKIIINENKKQQEKIDFLNGQVQSLNKEIQPKVLLINKQEKEISSLNNQVLSLIDEKNELMKRIKSLEISVQSLKQWEETSKTKINSLKKEIFKKEEKIDEIEKENFHLKSEVNEGCGKGKVGFFSKNNDLNDKYDKYDKYNSNVIHNINSKTSKNSKYNHSQVYNDNQFEVNFEDDTKNDLIDISPRRRLRSEIRFYEKKLSCLLEKLTIIENDYDKKAAKQIKTQEMKSMLKEQEESIVVMKKEANEIRVKLRELNNNKEIKN